MFNLSDTHLLGRLEKDIDGVLAFLGKEMFHFCDLVPEKKDIQFRFWINQRTPEMAVAISQAHGKKLRIPVSFAERLDSFELCKLLLIFDHVIICQDKVCDTNYFQEVGPAFIKAKARLEDPDVVLLSPLCTIGDYAIFLPKLPVVPGIGKDIPQELLAGPTTQYFASSDTIELNGVEFGGFHRVGKAWKNHPDWAFDNEYRELIQNGMLVVGGTMFGEDYDQECLSNGIDLSKFFGSILSDCSSVTSCGIDIQKAQALLKMDIPVLKGIKSKDLTKLINDDPVPFNAFRAHLSEGLKQIEGSKHSYDFAQQVKRIKKEVIDDGINELRKQYNRIGKLRALRAAGYTIGAIGLWASIYINIPEIANAFAVGSPLAIAIKEKSERIKEKANLEDNPCYFLWMIERK